MKLKRARELLDSLDDDTTAVTTILQMDLQKIEKYVVKYSMSKAKEQKIKRLEEERSVRLHSRGGEKIDCQPLRGISTQTRGRKNVVCALLESATRKPVNWDKRCFTDDEGNASGIVKSMM
jgi:hypothetical protein